MEGDIGNGLWHWVYHITPNWDDIQWHPNANWGAATNSTAQTMTRNDP